jgi:hypothetical protein
LTIPPPEEHGQTAPNDQSKAPPTGTPRIPSSEPSAIEPASAPAPSSPPGESPAMVVAPPRPTGVSVAPPASDASDATSVIARPATPGQPGTVFVPLAVTLGDGFKFGCGFFLALVVAMLIGFVLLAALFVLTNVFGMNLPLSR